jgi:hypothetical protein
VLRDNERRQEAGCVFVRCTELSQRGVNGGYTDRYEPSENAGRNYENLRSRMPGVGPAVSDARPNQNGIAPVQLAVLARVRQHDSAVPYDRKLVATDCRWSLSTCTAPVEGHHQGFKPSGSIEGHEGVYTGFRPRTSKARPGVDPYNDRLRDARWSKQIGQCDSEGRCHFLQ